MKIRKLLQLTSTIMLLASLPIGSNTLNAQPKSGDWGVPTRFGQFVFTVGPNRAEITKLATTFSNYAFGGITQNGTVISMPSPGWPISTNQFTINTNISPTGSIRLTITGTFVPAGDQASGTWTMVVSGQTDPGTWGPVIVTSAENVKPRVPERFLLAQNYPNPFNPSTTISYSLAKTAIVELRIFNTLGQEVTALVDEKKEAGFYQATWNSNAPSGVYFYRLKAGENKETKKMILLK